MDLDNFNTFIFDFDGTLVNSEPIHKLAHSKVLSLILNKEVVLTDEDFQRYIGKNDNEIFDMYKKDFNVDFNKEEMINKKVEMARDLLLSDKVEIFKYFYELAKLKGDKKFYIVSNQHEKILYPVLEGKNIIKYFDNIFCLSKMGVKKDIFYQNICNFIPNPNKIIVFEDDCKVLNYLNNNDFTVVAIQNTMNFQYVNNFENKIQAE